MQRTRRAVRFGGFSIYFHRIIRYSNDQLVLGNSQHRNFFPECISAVTADTLFFTGIVISGFGYGFPLAELVNSPACNIMADGTFPVMLRL